MDIQVIFTDLDDTLLHTDKTVSAYTRRVLKACRDRGVLLFAATARPPRTMGMFGLALDGAVCHNGGVALIRDETVWTYSMPPETAVSLAREILDCLPDATISAEAAGELYANFDVTGYWPGCPYIPWDCAALPGAPVEKLLAGVRSEEEWEQVRALVPPELTAQYSRGGLVMIQPRGVEKGKGVLAVCRRLGISPERAAAFGDDLSDISMLEVCGTGVAVANALDPVKAAAGCLCPGNDEDGPARWLEEHLL